VTQEQFENIESRLFELDLSDRSESSRISLKATRPFQAVYSPDGRHIAYAALSENQRAVFVMSRDGGDVTRLSDEWADDNSRLWSPGR
jgi:Tol biopolymer transport system component